MSLSRPPAAEHYPAAGQTGKPLCGALPRNREQTFRERFRHPGEGLREMHHRPETDLKRSPRVIQWFTESDPA